MYPESDLVSENTLANSDCDSCKTMDKIGIAPHSCQVCQEMVIGGTGTEDKILFACTWGDLQWLSNHCKLLEWIRKRSITDVFCDTPPLDSDSFVLSFRSTSILGIWEGVDKSLRFENTLALHVFTVKDDESSQFIETRPFSQSPGSPADLERCRRCLEDCKRNHRACRKREKSIKKERVGPKRILDIRDARIRLREVRDGSYPNYAALSYCWGNSKVQEEARTKKENLDCRLRRIEVSTLPQSIVDAIEVTRSLGLDYLWVDALCIVQDDPADVQLELSSMASIYLGSTVTIVGASAADSTEGFLGDRDLDKAYGALFCLPYKREHADGVLNGSLLLSENPLEGTEDDPIDTRAWAMQESILPLRRLRFGSRQTTWRCPTLDPAITLDGGRNPLPPDRDPNVAIDNPHQIEQVKSYAAQFDSLGAFKLLESWTYTIESYTARKLTNPSDRLPACAALAEIFAKTKGLEASEYLAGLWQSDLAAQLLWFCPEGTESKRVYGPSWTWASIEGQVRFPMRLPMSKTHLIPAEIKYIHSDLEHKDKTYRYSAVESGSLWLNGRLRQAHWDSISLRLDIDNFEYSPFEEIHWDPSDSPRPESIFCFELFRWAPNQGLCLVRRDNGVFERVGTYECKEDLSCQIIKSWYDEVEPQDIVLQ